MTYHIKHGWLFFHSWKEDRAIFTANESEAYTAHNRANVRSIRDRIVEQATAVGKEMRLEIIKSEK